MIVERKLQHWVRQGLALYAAQPALIEQAFRDDSQEGLPSLLGNGLLEDDEKQWLTDEWAGGVVRYAGSTFPITGNTITQLTVTGDPSAVFMNADERYQIVSPDVARVQQYLASKALKIEVSYSRVPVEVPAVTIRLQGDQQEQAYVGESLEIAVNSVGEERCYVSTEMAATYLLTIWTQNPHETLWLYHLLVNLYLRSQMQFAAWGCHHVRCTGSDLHPDLEYVPEQVYTRYLTISLTRVAQAVRIGQVPQVVTVTTVPQLQYTHLIAEG